MSPTFEAALRSWRFDPWLACALVIAGCIYLRGWLLLYRRDPWRWRGRHIAAFFGALWYARQYSIPWLGDIDNKLLWPDFAAHWPTAGPYRPPEFTPMGAWGIPAINTMLLLSSGVTVTWAHWALKRNDRQNLIFGLFLTILLGIIFLALQAYEYGHAYSELNLKLSTGVFGSTFFMLTGFHGFHVCVGMLMLLFITIRIMKGHFTPDRHFGFEGAAWYWHFVDVVWLGLYIVVYWL